MKARIAVVGASGFVGSAVVVRLRARGAETIEVRAPRIKGTIGASAPSDDLVAEICELIGDATCVVNAAGMADALAADAETLDGANGLWPGLLARACLRGGQRLVHVSSAAVQGRRALDSSEQYAAFSPYSRSKVMGEQAALTSPGEVCVVRPPGVHAPTRPVTRSIISLARSPLSSVAAPGTDNAPQSQLVNVADAIAFLALHEGSVPRIVHVPAEGITTYELLRAVGGRPPQQVPRALAAMIVSAARLTGKHNGRVAGHARRLEVLWFGQTQAPSWLTEAGWLPPAGHEGWSQMTAADKEVHQ